MKIILTESQIKKLQEKTQFEVFAEKRLGGAEKIAKSAKEKGGPSMLTFHHFDVKLKYYKNAKDGNFNIEEAKKEYQKYIKELNSTTKNVNITQTKFQKLVGLIEVLGELIIKHK
jgi:hypothetical protein